MSRRLVVVFLVVTPPVLAAPEAEEPRWIASGLFVEKPGPSGSERDFHRQFLHGTKIVGLLHLPGHFLVGADGEASRIDAFSDDKGTKLITAESLADAIWARAAPGGKYCEFSFQATKCPDPDARRLRVKGTVAALIGVNAKQLTVKVPKELVFGRLRPDAPESAEIDLGFGTLTITIRDGGAAGFRETAIAYRGRRPLKNLAALDVRRQPIEGCRQTGSAHSIKEPYEFFAWFQFDTAALPNWLEVTYFDSVEKVMAPVDLQAGVGLTEAAEAKLPPVRPAPPPHNVTWKGIHLRIVSAGPPDYEGRHSATPGTGITALLHSSKHRIVGTHWETSSVDSFTDDLNNSLLEPAKGDAFPWSNFGHLSLTRDGRYCRLGFRSDRWPAPGATAVRVKGSVTLLVGKDQKQFEHKDAPLRGGISLGAGVGTVTISEGRFQQGLEIAYRGSRPLNKLTAYDAHGNEIASSYSAPKTGGYGRVYEFDSRFLLERNVEVHRIQGSYFNAIEKIQLPFDFQTGLGLY